MAEDISKIVPLLSRMAIFKTLKPPQIEQVAKSCSTVSLAEKQVLFREGDVGDSFYIISSGKLRVSIGPDDQSRTLVVFGPADFVGEESLLYGTPRSATVTAVAPSQVLKFTWDQFASIIEKYPTVIPYFVAVVDGRRLLRANRFNWLSPDETVYLVIRRHFSELIMPLLPPLGIAAFALLAFLLAIVLPLNLLHWLFGLVGLGLSLFSGVWIWWRYIDWGNDFYIVTNQRIIWLEKVVGLYENRQDAPFGTVVSLGTTTDQYGRWFHYGDVNVRTFIGQLTLIHVHQPEVLIPLIEEYLNRGKQIARQVEGEAIDRAIRQRLGLPSGEAPKPPPPPPPQPKLNAFQQFWAEAFKMRYQEGNAITFRKHWILLLADTWRASAGIFLLLILFILRLFGLLSFIPAWLIFVFWLLGTGGLVAWWIYGYTDWKNDIYRITDDQIIDIYKEPFGLEEKKTASIDGVASIRSSRSGFIGLLFNYGDVVATVGADKFTFDGVYNPSMVEQEIFYRITLRKRKAREVELLNQREYIADWIAAYHRQVSKLPAPGNPPKTG